jgi:hypothetical protein
MVCNENEGRVWFVVTLTAQSIYHLLRFICPVDDDRLCCLIWPLRSHHGSLSVKHMLAKSIGKKCGMFLSENRQDEDDTDCYVQSESRKKQSRGGSGFRYSTRGAATWLSSVIKATSCQKRQRWKFSCFYPCTSVISFFSELLKAKLAINKIKYRAHADKFDPESI